MKKTTRTVVVLTALFVAAATGYSQQNIHGAAVDVNLADTELYLQKGADVNARNKDGLTPLIAAADKGHLEVVKFLVEKGADVNAKDNNGRTPLIAAAPLGYLEMVKFLVDKGADVNAKNNNGITPLKVATAAVAEVLKQHGAKK